MDSTVARKLYRALEPYHAMIYFVPEASERYKAYGIGGRMGYFASRGAAMGAVSAEMIISAFYNFNPGLVRSAIPAAWQRATPAQIIDARFAGADVALRRVLGERVNNSEMAEAAQLAREASTACTPQGRITYAAHATLEWPTEPHMVLWHAITLLREFRFGGHVAALLTDGVGPCEALVMHAGTGEASRQALQTTRSWSDEEWEAAAQALRERDWLTPERTLTDEGKVHRDRVEQLTDQLALAPWQHLGEAKCERLRELGRPLSRAIIDAKAIPSGL
ncbi:MAG: hypothetical protein NVS4B12_26390 [Ktedonobacteraceae bacterium]